MKSKAVLMLFVLGTLATATNAFAQFGPFGGGEYRNVRNRIQALQNGGIYNRPTVSPYVTMGLNAGSQSSGLVYVRQVRPRLESRERQQYTAIAVRDLGSQVRGLSAQAYKNPYGEGVTGHQTRFLHYSHFYDPPR